MNMLVSFIHPIISKDEINTLLPSQYKNELQTLATAAEADILKIKELMGLKTDTEIECWQDIKIQFLKNKVIKGVGSEDRKSQIIALLAEFKDNLQGIKEGVKRN